MQDAIGNSNCNFVVCPGIKLTWPMANWLECHPNWNAAPSCPQPRSSDDPTCSATGRAPFQWHPSIPPAGHSCDL